LVCRGRGGKRWKGSKETEAQTQESKTNGTQASKTQNKAETQIDGYLKGGNEGSGKEVL
jgi:hypothetical protein